MNGRPGLDQTGPADRRSPGIVAASFAFAVVVLVASACSPEGGIELGQATSNERIDPCALLTVEEIDQTLGWQLPQGERPREHESDGQALCSWEEQRSGLVHVQLYEGDGTDRFEAARSEVEDTGAATDATVAAADEAWEDSSQGVVGMLVGDHFVQVAVWGTAATEGEHLALAELVAGRL